MNSSSPYFAKQVIKQFEKQDAQIFICDSDLNTVADPNGNTYSVTPTSCNCYVFVSQKILCCHVIAMRKECGCDELFSESDVPSKYSLKVYAEETNIPQAVVNPDVRVSVNPSARRILNSVEKFNIAKPIFLSMASVLSGLGQRDFECLALGNSHS